MVSGLMAELIHALDVIVEYAILMFEYIGVGAIIFSGIRGLYHYLRREPHTRLKLEQGLAMGLGFLLGGEILRTVVIRDMKEIAIVGGIIVLRVALTILLHWETKNERAELAEHEEENGSKKDELKNSGKG